MTTSGTTIGSVVDYTTEPEGVYPLTIVAGSQDDTFAFKTTAGTYLAWSSGNSLTTAEEVADASSWTVSFTEAGAADIYNVGTAARKLQYNSGSPRFACYTSSQQAPYLWKQVAGDDVAKPVLPSSTSFVGSIEVAITAAEGATIYYTLDGTDPTTESTVYSEALTITETTTVKAIAVVNEVASAPAEATYTALAKSTIAEAQAAAAGTTVYVEGVIVASAANGAVLYDGTDYLYYYNNANALVVGQKVRMVGTLATYGGAKQLPNSTTITELGTEAVAHPAATALDGAAFD
ncbi:MAG: chitobiase/beta-hexosaminidase C-terminal domain-containing protein, partial [Bacteroidaceae bacterium]|nr:chitobiase/beta-hexosaminidase C-terminal domain-containing protein [Bacteroidaceae bacterium]